MHVPSWWNVHGKSTAQQETLSCEWYTYLVNISLVCFHTLQSYCRHIMRSTQNNACGTSYLIIIINYGHNSRNKGLCFSAFTKAQQQLLNNNHGSLSGCSLNWSSGTRKGIVTAVYTIGHRSHMRLGWILCLTHSQCSCTLHEVLSLSLLKLRLVNIDM